MSPEKRWKRQERRVARLLNARRNPHDGSGGPDVENTWLVAEVKDRKKLPEWLLEALDQARTKAERTRLGVVVLTSSSTPQVLVVLHVDDFREWFVGGPPPERR